MKKAKKKTNFTVCQKPLIDATAKGSIIIMPVNENISTEDIEKEIQQLHDTIDRIREKYYAHDAALKRIQSRTVVEMCRAKKQQIFTQLKNTKIIN